jgi:magnesium transporter
MYLESISAYDYTQKYFEHYSRSSESIKPIILISSPRFSMVTPSLGQNSKSEDGKYISITNSGMTWTEVIDPTPAKLAILARDYHFRSFDLDSCLSTMQLTKIEERDDYLFIILQIPHQVGQGVIGCNQISMFLGKDYLVTVHPFSLKTISELFQSCRDDEMERNALMKSPAYLAYGIIDRITDGISAILDNVQTTLNSIEAVVFDERKSSARVINLARRQIASLRRIVYPLDLYIGDLKVAQKFSKEDLTIYFSDIRHKVGKISARIEEMKEIVEIYNDTDFITSSNRTNTVLSILTLIFTLTLPAALVAAIYGMNIPIPGALVPGALEYFGDYTSLLFIALLMLVPTLIMGAYFKRRGWF